MSRASARNPIAPSRIVRDNKHFLIAAVILAVTAIGWSTISSALGLVTVKQPVPWAGGVEVTAKDHRLTTLADRFGNFSKVKEYEFAGNDEDALQVLGIATPFDKDPERYDRRRSNWYVNRIYEDKRPGVHHQYWNLAVYFYTGGLDLVPHIPDNCLVAGGMTVLNTKSVKFTAPNNPESWREMEFCRTHYESPKTGEQFVEYYTFSLNGLPESSRDAVRGKLINPFLRYSYFAKVQLSPREPVVDLASSDKAAEEFLRAAMPEILKALPTAADVASLSAARPQ